MLQRVISPDQCGPFLEDFSRLHQGALVTLRVGARDEVVDQPFLGVSSDGGDLIVHTGRGAGRHLGYRVPHVVAVRIEETDEGADAAIAMTTDDGRQTEVRFRSPIRADLLDPAVE